MLQTVKANIRYLNPEWRERPDDPAIYSKESRRGNTSFHSVEVADARPLAERGELQLDTHGFALLNHKTAVANFRDDAEIERAYYPEIEALIRRVTGADHVLFFFHTRRTEDPTEFNGAYARYVHCDFSEESARRLSHKLMLERGVCSAQEVERYDFAWYNTWQPIERDVQSNPLLMIDSQTLDLADMKPYAFGAEYDGDDYDRGAVPFYSERHRHYYFPQLRTDELIVLKQIDSRPDRARMCPHTSFDDVNTPPDAPRRRSIEVRMVCLFERD